MARDREQTASSRELPNGQEGGPSPAARRLLWIIAYYAVAGALTAWLWRTSPDVRALIQSDRLRELASGGLLPSAAKVVATEEGTPGRATILALLGALATTLPLAWVYSLTRRKRGFQQSMVHTLILLPLAIAGMVVLIQHSLALAFGVAGIVGMLRFRNTLEDTKDGVYIFVATSVGISAAVGVLIVGILTSVLFNVCVLLLWWIDFARAPTPGIRGGLSRLARLPKVNGRRSSAPPAPQAWMADDAFANAAQAWRRQLRITAEHRALDPEGRFNTTLRVHTLQPATTQPIVEQVLAESAKRWELVGITPGDNGRFTLKYLLRLRKDARSELLTVLRDRGTPQVVGVEFR